MRLTHAPVVLAAVLFTAACASMPSGPSVLVLPGSGKSMEQFQGDDVRCRQAAVQQMQATEGGDVPAQLRFDMGYMQCMYAAGHQVPVAGRGPGSGGALPAGAPPVPAGTPPPPPGTPPPPPPSGTR
jgi:hypothetical protein